MHVQNLKLFQNPAIYYLATLRKWRHNSCKPVFWHCKDQDSGVWKIYCLIFKISISLSRKGLIIAGTIHSFFFLYKINKIR